MSGWAIRKGRPSDLDAVKALADANKAAIGFVLRPALVAAIERGWLLVVEAEGAILGFANYRHRRDQQSTLYEICVAEPYRGQGIGRALMDALVAEAQALGKTWIQLKCPVDLPANRFYQRLGCELIGTEDGRRRPLNIWRLRLNP
ncbi:MAG TPA: N-acetyltransferase [Anaerolineae bacterium]|nr:N-acetyltransferase [Anaerolineae bacterium]